MIFLKSKFFPQIHSSYEQSIHKIIPILVLLAIALVLVRIFPSFNAVKGFEGYLPLHTMFETISIVIAMQVSGLGWNVLSNKVSGRIVFLSLIFLGVAILDFSHLLSTVGMPDYVTPSSTDKALYFWLAARMLSAIGLLLFSISSLRILASKIYQYILLICISILIGLIHWLLLFHPNLFEDLFFVPGQGLTTLKINIEYIIIAINVITAFVLWRRMHKPHFYHASALFAAVCIMAMSDLFFTFYSDVTDIYNVLGHIYKVIAYIFLYRAIFVTTVQQPYEELNKTQKQLHEKNQLLDKIVNNIPHMIFLKHASDLRYALSNKAGEELTGFSHNTLLNHSDYEFYPKDQADFFLQKDRETLQNGVIVDIPEEPIETAHGTRILHTKKIPIKDEHGQPLYLLGISEDITKQKLSSDSLLKLSLAVEQSPNSIVITDLEGNIEYVNNIFTKVTGYTKDEALGQNPRIFKSDETPNATYEEMWATLKRGDIWHGELINRRKDKSIYIESATISPVKQADGTITNYVAIKEDITEKKRSEAHIENLANFDQLTGLPNRAMLNDRVTYLLNAARRNKEPLTVMFLDLDHFKNINDTLGHTIGDKVLIEIAKRIRKTVREVDTVSRSGGDEFIMLFPNTDSNAAMHIATKLIEEISKASVFDHNELTITPSIGIAIYPNDGKDFETLLKNADTAMYRVKNNSRNAFHFFTQEMQLNLARNLHLENALRHALKRNELEVYYQPQISLSDGHVIGAEALLRWHHPELGMISPAEFIPIAESSGQIIEIGEWVLRTAIGQTKEWIDSGFAPMTIAVNISAMQFRQKNLLRLVTDILGQVQLAPQYLELELTEAVTMHDPKSVIDVMNKFDEQGIRMSIDDFGTGYSSLSYLKKFKVYKLKIDQSFIRDITNDSDDRAIVSAIIDMAHNLGLQTIAEGVETAEQLAFLRLHGCNEVQGYYFSKPLPCVEFEQFLQNKAHGTL